jgi:H+/gluconate symporter-like permease
MAVAGGMLYGPWMARRIFVPVPLIAGAEPVGTTERPAPAVPLVLFILLLPVLLMLAATVLRGSAVLGFFGHPFTALTVTALAAMFFLGLQRGLGRDAITRLATESLAPVGTLLAIMGGGGAFKQVIVDSGVGPYAGGLLAASSVSPLVVAYLIAAAMRIAQGSATVAIITAAGIVAPLVKPLHGYSPEIIVLAVCCGGTILSHVNDAGFWLVNQYFGMSVTDTLRSWSAMKIMMSLLGFGIVLAVHALLP